jgi:hypothetical protein
MSSSRPEPYVGVSGVVSLEQQDVLRSQAEPLLQTRHRLALGVKAVHKTQWLDIENRFGRDWYPVGSDIVTSVAKRKGDSDFLVAQMFLDTNEANRLQVEDYEASFVRKLMGRTAGWLSAVQFDLLPWHRIDYSPLFEEMKAKREGLEILLQCQGPIMKELGPGGSLKALDRYKGLVDHVLFDASHGTGEEMNVDALKPFVEEAAARDWLGVGVAGGLNGERVERHIPELIEFFPGLSLDAEGQLHINSDRSGHQLNLQATGDYLLSAAAVVRPAD